MTTTSAQQPLTFRTQAFIDGTFATRRPGSSSSAINPATGKTLVQITFRAIGPMWAGPSVRLAGAFEDGRWSRQSPEQRKETLLRFAQLLEENAEEIARLDTLDAGKPITDCGTIRTVPNRQCFRL